MVELEVTNGRLRIEPRGAHKLWSFRRRLEVALDSIRRVEREPAAARRLWKGIRAPGTHVPWLITAGTYYRDGERHFWAVRRPERSIAIELDGERFDRIFVEVEDPDAAVELIERSRAG